MPDSSNSLIIFTAAPTGLGHIRVMDALIDGLPIGTKSVELGIKNEKATKLHMLGSRNRFLLYITELIQNTPILENIYTLFYTMYLQRHSRELIPEFEKINTQFPDLSSWVIVSTHFALAYGIGEIKEELAKKFNKKIILCVVVTDDSPQKIWAVQDADAIFVPSQETAIKLGRFFKDSLKIHTISFPVSPRLTQSLSEQEFIKFKQQLDPDQHIRTHIEIPISGAAVQLTYLEEVVRNLSMANEFEFTVVGEISSFTEDFFAKMRNNPMVQLTLGNSARQAVTVYESLFYQLNKPGVEITKPSEQMFKALIPPQERGGLILLLTPPIGRQEQDNLKFLIRHNLAPDDTLQKKLEELLIDKGLIPMELRSTWFYQASHFRAIRLPVDPVRASKFITKLKETGLMLTMLSFVPEKQIELTSDGVSQIWQYIGKMVE